MEAIRNAVRAVVRQLARLLNKLSGGHISPKFVTLFGFAMHIPIAFLIARGYFIYAGLLLIFFGLFDTLDGELARLQQRTSKSGMFLDSVTDKMKEAILYIGIAAFFVWSDQAGLAVWAVLACGAGLLVSYINAWGEVVTKDIKDDEHRTNKSFRTGTFTSGVMTFDVRMFLIIVGLLVNQLGAIIIFVGLLSWVTALQRTNLVLKKLHKHEN